MKTDKVIEGMLKRFIKLRKRNCPFFFNDNDYAMIDGEGAVFVLERIAKERGLL